MLTNPSFKCKEHRPQTLTINVGLTLEITKNSANNVIEFVFTNRLSAASISKVLPLIGVEPSGTYLRGD